MYMNRITRPLAALLCTLVPLAAPLQAQTAPACENVYGNYMATARMRLAEARREMESTFSYTWESYGFNCNYNIEARQACQTASDYLSLAARPGVQIVKFATVSGCYTCDNQSLWQLAYDMDAFATALAQQNFTSNGSLMFEEMTQNHIQGMSACQTGQTAQPGQPSPDPSSAGAPPALPDPPDACSSVDAYADVRLNSGFGWVLDNTGLPDCVTTCTNEPSCTGYDYNSASATCVIRSERQSQTGLERFAGWTHYECVN